MDNYTCGPAGGDWSGAEQIFEVNLAVTAAKIANNTITAGQIATGTITATEIANLTITAGKIGNHARQQHPSHFGRSLKPGGYVNTIAENILALNQHIANVKAHAQ